MASTRFAMSGKNAGWIEQALPVTMDLAVPASVASGDVVAINAMVVYAQEDRGGDGKASCMLPGYFAETILVYGRTDGAGSAVAIGDRLYADTADGQINKDNTNGVAFGFALGTVTSGSSAEIMVLFGQ